MNKETLWPRVVAAMSIAAVVLVTNEGYRQVRGLVDDVRQSKHDIAVLKRELYVLQVQLDTAPATASAPGTIATPVTHSAAAAPFNAPFTLPMPAPIGQMRAPSAPAIPNQAGPKPQPADEAKSTMSVVLMGDAKATATSPYSAPAKSSDVPRIDVQLVGDAK